MGLHKCFLLWVLWILILLDAHAQAVDWASKGEVHPSRLLIGLKPGIKGPYLNFLTDIKGKIAYRFHSQNTLLIEFPKGFYTEDGLRQIADAIAKKSYVAFVEPDQKAIFDKIIPSGSLFKQSYAFHHENSKIGTKDGPIYASKAWQVSQDSKDVIVAIVDSGIDYDHPDLKGKIWRNSTEIGLDANGNAREKNGIDDDNNGFIDDFQGFHFYSVFGSAASDNKVKDDLGHGTMIAGIIGERAQNNFGSAGINSQIRMMPVKVSERLEGAYLSTVIAGIEYASAMGAHIINLSLGFRQSEGLYNAMLTCQRRGQLVIASSGQTSVDAKIHPQYPAAYPLSNIISVAASDPYGNLARFSNFGDNVDIAAPGVDILSTSLNGTYEKSSGTSFAVAYVSAAAALVKSTFFDWDYLAIKKRVLSSVDLLPSLRPLLASGGGRLNAAYAVAKDDIPPSVPTDLKVLKSLLKEFDLEFSPAGDDGAEGRASGYFARIAMAPIDSEQAWEKATEVLMTPLRNAEMKSVYRISDLFLNAKGYIAVRARDKVGNLGEISESIPFELMQLTREGKILDGRSLTGFKADPPWGIEVEGGNSYFSDSPFEFYKDGIKVGLKGPAMTAADASAIFAFKARYDIEVPFDSAFLELSLDGVTWINVWEVTRRPMKMRWRSEYVQLKKVFSEAKFPIQFQFRFQLVSDGRIHYDGLHIDDIEVLKGADLGDL